LRSELVAVRTEDGFAGAFHPKGPLDGDTLGRLAATGERSAERTIHLLSGELFNREEICRQLALADECSDETLVAAAFHRWGRDFPLKLRGSFCVLVWNAEQGEGLIASDQLGLRTAYVHDSGDHVSFATEIRTLLRILRRRPAPDTVCLAQWLASTEMQLGRTLFEGVSKLPGGASLDLGAEGTRIRRYWEPRFQEPTQMTRAEAVEGLWGHVVDAVGKRLTDSAPTALIMSGGVDSSSVAAAAVESLADDAQVRGYSVVFPGYPQKRVDESARITALVAGLQLPNTRVRVEARGAFALGLDFLSDWDLPATGAGYLIEWPLLELAETDGARAVLDGQGGDELYALSGYLIADRVLHGRLLSSWRLTQRLPGAAGRSRRQLFDAWRYFAVPGILPPALYRWMQERRRPLGPQWLAPAARRLLRENAVDLGWRDRHDVPRWWAHKAHLLTAARQSVGMPEYLRQRAASSGLVARPPLFDVDLVEFALRIPPELEFAAELDRPLIREAMRGRVPDVVRLDVLKSNLAPFYHESVSGPDLGPIREVLTSPDLEIAAYVDVGAVRRLVEHPPAAGVWGSDRWATDVWRLMAAECWLRAQGDSDYVDAFRNRDDLPRPSWKIDAQPDPMKGQTA
jgi:asparagine synthase (glutamine-hydrolysing)